MLGALPRMVVRTRGMKKLRPAMDLPIRVVRIPGMGIVSRSKQ